MKQYKNGLAPDPRTPEQKAKDYTLPAGAVILNWVEKKPEEWKKYTPREQDGSLSCMAQAGAKAMEILGYGVVSAHPPYRSRNNFPEGGMYQQNLGEVYKKIGTTTEALDVSEWQNEATMNRDIAVATPIKSGGYFFANTFEEVVQAIEIAKHCVVIMHANKEEWKPIPVYNGKEINFGHGICAVDYFLFNGVKTILLEDSTGHNVSFDKNGQRLITEEYFNKRGSGAIYFVKNITEVPYVFTKVLKQGMSGFDVKKLQLRLGINADGKFGTQTKNAVIAFQIKHQLKPDGIVGNFTNIVLNLH